MTHRIRIIPKLEIKGPNLIKGIQYDGFRSLGKAVDFAISYYQEGADELIYQDVVASLYQRDSLLDLVKCTAKNVFIPLTVIGGIRSIKDISSLLNAGADKVGINTQATIDSNFIRQASQYFGSQCIVGSVEAYRNQDGSYSIWTNYGKDVTPIDAVEFSKELVAKGVGELIVSVINNDGLGVGFDLDFISKIAHAVEVPVIAASGAKNTNHVHELIQECPINGVAIASMFHYYYALNNFEKSKKSEQLSMIKEHQDRGNHDFVLNGYGGKQELSVVRCSINALKKSLDESKIAVRME